jgi:hypothetical protein
MDILVAILIFVAVVVVAALLFGGWVIVSIFRLLARAIGGGPRAPLPPARSQPPRLPAAMSHRVLCGHANCRSANPPTARFCRRCGRNVAGPAPVRNGAVVRRVAMW